MRKELTVIAVLVTVFAIAAALATPGGEKISTADEGVRLVPANASGPVLIEALADGPATIKLVSTSRGDRTWPDDGLGDSGAVFNLRANVARPFYVQGDKVDSVYVDLLTGATEVITTWTLAN